jgi:prevent-host-death family protein
VLTEVQSEIGEWTMSATEFRAKCLGLIDEVAESGREIVITKRGKPVARLVPYRRRPKSLFGMERGRIEILGDITSPIDVEWNAEMNPDRVLNP